MEQFLKKIAPSPKIYGLNTATNAYDVNWTQVFKSIVS